MKTNKKLCLTLCLVASMLLAACSGSSSDISAGSSMSNAGSSMPSQLHSITDGLNISADTSTSSYSGITGGFGSSSKYESVDASESYSEDYYAEEAEPEYTSESVDLDNVDKQDSTNNDIQYVDTKLIYHCNLSVETLNYDESYAKLQEMIERYDCFIENERFIDNNASYYGNGYAKGRQNTIIIRVPSKNYQAFLNEESELGNILSKTSNVENITMEYYDTTTQIEGLQYQLDRLVEMLRQTTDVEDMIQINREITNVENQINSLKTTIRTYDMDAAYSYIGIDLLEVVEYSEKVEPVKKSTFMDRLKNQISNTWEELLDNLEDLLFGIIDLLPTLVIVGLVVLLIIIVNKINKKNNKGIITEAEILLSEQSEKPEDKNVEE